MNEIDLEHATLLWNDGPAGFAVVVDIRSPVDRFANLDNSRGACDGGWAQMTDTERLLTLMSVVWSAVLRDSCDTRAMHRALLAIPQYRGWIAQDVSGLEDWDQPKLG